MTLSTFILIYLTGYVASYFMCRTNSRIIDERYTVGDRKVMLIASLISWIMFFAAGIILLTHQGAKYFKWLAENDDEPAKW